MELNLRKESFSHAYVSALCSTVGCSIAHWTVDDDSVDLTLKKRAAAGAIPSPMLDIQLKATARATRTEAGVTISLKKKNFDELRQPCHFPRILVVVTLPTDVPAEWLDHSDTARLSLMACGYWASLTHLSPSANVTSTTVTLDHVLTAEVLDDLMERVSADRPLTDG